MGSLRRVIMGDGSLSNALGPVLFVGAGLLLLYMGFVDIREALRLAPERVACADFLRTPNSHGRWVSLTGCRLDLATSASRRWNGWLPGQARDAGVGGKTLEMFIPLAEKDAPADDVPHVVVATTDKHLLGLIDQLQQLEAPEAVEAFVLAHEAEFDQVLGPEPLVGYAEPLGSSASRAALSVLMAQDAVVLEQNREPQRANALCSVLLGMALIMWGVWPLARRWRLERETG